MDLSALMGQLGPLREAMGTAESGKADVILTGRAGGGAVEVELKGDLSVPKVRIAEAASAAADGDVSMLEDLVAAAMTDALKQYKQRFGATPEEQLQKAMAGRDLGSLFGGLSG